MRRTISATKPIVPIPMKAKTVFWVPVARLNRIRRTSTTAEMSSQVTSPSVWSFLLIPRSVEEDDKTLVEKKEL